MAFCPSRLSVARRRQGLTRRGLAKKAGLGERTVVAYESGEHAPSEENLSKLAHVLGFPRGFFEREELERLSEDGVSFRSLSRMAAADRERALAGGELALELSDWIERRFQLPAADVPDLHPHANPDTAAQALRIRWGLGDKPISNMVWLLESRGVRVYSLAESSKEIDAFSFWRGSQPYVFLNTLKSAERSRFDAAHELAHLVLHRHGQAVGRQAEQEANAFASSFLMPRSSVIAHAPRQPSLLALIGAKRLWGVSLGALAYQMHECDLLTDWAYRSLWIQIQEQGYRDDEPQPMSREMSKVWPQVFGSLMEEGITRSDLARELDWPLAEIRALVFQLVLSAQAGGDPDTKGQERSALTPGAIRLVH